MVAQATRALIEELFDAYNEPGLDRAALLYAEDCRYANRSLGISIEGRDALRANMQAFLDAFPDRRLRPLRVIADGGAPPWRPSSWPRAPGGRGCRQRGIPTAWGCAASSR